MVKIILLGSFAGNNAGDMVVLESIIYDFNKLALNKADVHDESIFSGVDASAGLELVIPSLNDKGMRFLCKISEINADIVIKPVPIDKKITTIVKAVKTLIKEFAAADFIYTTAGILFAQKIWNPLYNFAAAYLPFMAWAKIINPKVKIIGYNVGITFNREIVGKAVLKKCICLHDRIYLREADDLPLLERLGYKGEVFCSADNVFGYNRPNIRSGYEEKRKIYINLTLYGVDDTEHFIDEIVKLVSKLQKEYDIYFFQTSSRDLKVAQTVCRKMGLGNSRIYYPGLCGYQEIQGLLSECDVLIGMRMHSIIFALKNGCPIIAVEYAHKVGALMRDLGLEQFLVSPDNISADEILSGLKTIHMWNDSAKRVYEEINDRYLLCEKYKWG